MTTPYLITYRDVIDHLNHYVRGGAQDAEQTDLREAIQFAYRDFALGREWRYFLSEYRAQLEAAYTTGTVAYDHTGGAYERQLTLTGGSWPDWAAYGRVILGGIVYDVEQRQSYSVLTLTAANNPGADVASGATYTLYRSHYTLPSDFRSLTRPLAEQNDAYLRYVDPADWQYLEHVAPNTASSPIYWTLVGDPNFVGSMAIAVQPYLTTAQGIRFTYQRDPRPLRYSGYAASEYAGTISASLASTTVTGSGTAFTTGMIGSVLRLTSSGDYPSGLNGLNPFDEQKIITAVASATSLTIDTPTTAAYSAKKYVISDYIDLFPGYINCFYDLAAYRLAQLRNRSDLVLRRELYKASRLRAQAADAMLLRPVDGGARSTGEWSAPLGDDVA